jgi:hypothetical protein
MSIRPMRGIPNRSILANLRCAASQSAAIAALANSRGTVVHPLLERRKFGRGTNCAQGWIRAQGRPLIVCKIQNRTPAGAFLAFQKPGWLPFRFELLTEDPKKILNCEIRHVLSGGIGVHFIATATEVDKVLRLSNSTTESDKWTGKNTTSGSRPLARR